MNERLDGLVMLLQSFGVDGVDSGALLEEQKRQSRSAPKKRSQTNGISGNDAQILEIVKKLQQAQADSPKILEALQSPELLALATLAAQKNAVHAHIAPAAPAPPKRPSLDDVFDEDDNYPKIGPGYSDEISVVSEMSTPTVMRRQQIADEEYYREVKGGPGALPPIHEAFAGSRPRHIRAPILRPGMGTVGNTGKSKNMLGQVMPSRRVVPSKAAVGGGGAAAQRRLNYQMAMSKLESSGFGTQPDPVPMSPAQSTSSINSRTKPRTSSGSRSISSTGSGSGSAGGGSASGRRKLSSKPKSSKVNIDWGIADDNAWPAFEADGGHESSPDFFVDDDGFFTEDVFGANDEGAPKSRRKKVEKSKSPSRRSAEGSSGSRSKKKSSREEGEASTRKERKVKKDKDRDRDSSRRGPTSDRDSSRRGKDKDKTERRKARRE